MASHRKPKSNAGSASYTATSSSKRSSVEMIRVHVEAANYSNDAAYVQAAFDGANRDEYF